MAKTTVFRIRVTEMAGSQLRRILPNTPGMAGTVAGRGVSLVARVLRS